MIYGHVQKPFRYIFRNHHFGWNSRFHHLQSGSSNDKHCTTRYGEVFMTFSVGEKKITSGCSNLGIILFICAKLGNTNQSITWMRFFLVIFYGLYHGKSRSNHHLGKSKDDDVFFSWETKGQLFRGTCYFCDCSKPFFLCILFACGEYSIVILACFPSFSSHTFVQSVHCFRKGREHLMFHFKEITSLQYISTGFSSPVLWGPQRVRILAEFRFSICVWEFSVLRRSAICRFFEGDVFLVKISFSWVFCEDRKTPTRLRASLPHVLNSFVNHSKSMRKKGSLLNYIRSQHLNIKIYLIFTSLISESFFQLIKRERDRFSRNLLGR